MMMSRMNTVVVCHAVDTLDFGGLLLQASLDLDRRSRIYDSIVQSGGRRTQQG
jgi:hypothetical protein